MYALLNIIIGKLLINIYLYIISLYHILALSSIFSYFFSSGVICLVWIRLVGFAKRIFACTLISALIQRGNQSLFRWKLRFQPEGKNAKRQTHLAVFCSNNAKCCWGTYRSTHQLDVRQGRHGTGSLASSVTWADLLIDACRWDCNDERPETAWHIDSYSIICARV